MSDISTSAIRSMDGHHQDESVMRPPVASKKNKRLSTSAIAAAKAKAAKLPRAASSMVALGDENIEAVAVVPRTISKRARRVKPPAPTSVTDDPTSCASTISAAAPSPCPSTAPSTSGISSASIPDDMAPGTIVCMRTHQTQQWRTLLDALKDLVPECSVTFDSEGMKLISMDPAHVALIHLTAKSEVYFCKTVTKVGLNVTALYKVLRGLTSAGFVLEFSITEDNSDFLNVIISNSEKRTCTRTMLKLLRLADEEISIPSTTFQRVLSIPSGDFQRYIRELAGISTQITITSTIDKLVLSASGSMGSTSIEIKPTSGGMHWIHKEANGQDGKVDDDNGEVSGTFLSRYLERFSRPLDLSVDLFIKRNYPLVLRYTMPSACVRLVVASVVQEDEDDINGEE